MYPAKKIFTLIGILFLFISCSKKHDCFCTYVADINGPSGGKENLVEHTDIKRLFRATAKKDCSGLKDKYLPQSFYGTCIIE